MKLFLAPTVGGVKLFIFRNIKSYVRFLCMDKPCLWLELKLLNNSQYEVKFKCFDLILNW